MLSNRIARIGTVYLIAGSFSVHSCCIFSFRGVSPNYRPGTKWGRRSEKGRNCPVRLALKIAQRCARRLIWYQLNGVSYINWQSCFQRFSCLGAQTRGVGAENEGSSRLPYHIFYTIASMFLNYIPLWTMNRQKSPYK